MCSLIPNIGDLAVFAGALLCVLEDAGGVEGVLGCRWRGGLVEDGVADGGIKEAIVARDGFYGLRDEDAGMIWGEGSPGGGGVAAPGFGDFGVVCEAFGGFLGVEAVFDVVAEGSADGVAGAGDRGEAVSCEGCNLVGVTQADGERVDGLRVGTLDEDFRGDGEGQSKEEKGLVDEVRAEVEQDAGAIAGGFSPGGRIGVRSPAVEGGLKRDNFSEFYLM